MVYEEEAVADMAYDSEEPVESPSAGGGDPGIGIVDPVSPAPANADRMIITTVNLSLETQEFDAGLEQIVSIVEGFGGFVQDSYVQGQSMFAEGKGSRMADYTVRIPSERLDEFVGSVGGVFNITSKQQSGQDVTDSYYDTEARLRSLRIQEERLLAMLESAAELEYLLQVQTKLAEVQYEIDRYTASKLRMENQVAMSTVYLHLSEVIEYTPIEPTPVTFGQRIGATAVSSLTSFVDALENLLLAVIWMLPFLILLGIIAGVIIYFHIKRRGRRAAIASAVPVIPEYPEKRDSDSGDSE
jgi:hypothetical protein